MCYLLLKVVSDIQAHFTLKLTVLRRIAFWILICEASVVHQLLLWAFCFKFSGLEITDIDLENAAALCVGVLLYRKFVALCLQQETDIACFVWTQRIIPRIRLFTFWHVDRLERIY